MYRDTRNKLILGYLMAAPIGPANADAIEEAWVTRYGNPDSSCGLHGTAPVMTVMASITPQRRQKILEKV